MVKKSAKIYLEEPESQCSASKVFFDTRAILWSIVEAVKDVNETSVVMSEVAADESLDEFLAISDDLPFSFGSSKKFKKRKPQNGKHTSVKKSKSNNSLSGLFACYEQHILSEHHVHEDSYFYVKSNHFDDGHEKYHVVRVLGVSCDEPIGNYVVVRYLFTSRQESINRNQLIPIISYLCTFNVFLPSTNLTSSSFSESSPTPSSSSSTLYEYINEDLWYQLNSNKPSFDVHDKYWDQRYRIFSLYDKGIQLDPESWYSITYECIGNYLVERCLEIAKIKNLGEIKAVIDGFSGCGGITIPLGKQKIFSIAVDIDPEKLKYLRYVFGFLLLSSLIFKCFFLHLS
jgi:hypothetical protein